MRSGRGIVCSASSGWLPAPGLCEGFRRARWVLAWLPYLWQRGGPDDDYRCCCAKRNERLAAYCRMGGGWGCHVAGIRPFAKARRLGPARQPRILQALMLERRARASLCVPSASFWPARRPVFDPPGGSVSTFGRFNDDVRSIRLRRSSLTRQFVCTEAASTSHLLDGLPKS